MVAMILWEIFLENYYMPLVEIKDFNAWIENKTFFDPPLKNKQAVYEKPIKMPRNYK